MRLRPRPGDDPHQAPAPRRGLRPHPRLAQEHGARHRRRQSQASRGLNVFRWDGRTDGNVIAKDGRYSAEIHLAGQHQTIVLPNPIQLDTTRARRQVGDDEPRRVLARRRPSGGLRPDSLRAQQERARESLSRRQAHPPHVPAPGGRQPLVVRHCEREQCFRPGSYTLEVGAVDAAGNSTPVAERQRVRVQIRFIELASKRIVVRAGEPFSIGVSTDATRYTWKLGRRKSFATGPVLRLRLRRVRGRYTLTVDRARPCRSRGGDRQVSGLAQLGGLVACIGLAILFVGRNRSDRVAGLGFAALGTVLLGDRGRTEPAGPRARRRVRRARSRRRARGVSSARWPWLCPLLGARVRAGAHRRARRRRELEAARAALRRHPRRGDPARAGELVDGDAPRARAPRRCVAARGASSPGRAVARLEQGRARGRDRSCSRSTSRSRCSRSRSRGCRGARLGAAGALRACSR